MIDVDGIVAVALFMFWIWALLDCIATDSAMCRNLPKPMWLILVLILPDIGALAWLLLGRPEKAGWRPGSTDYATPRRAGRARGLAALHRLAADQRPPVGGARPRARALGARAQATRGPRRAAHPAGSSGVQPDLDAWAPAARRARSRDPRRELELRQRELDRRELEQLERDLDLDQ